MDEFLETYTLLRLNYKGIENLNGVIINKETESVIKNLPRNKTPDSFMVISSKHSKKT